MWKTLDCLTFILVLWLTFYCVEIVAHNHRAGLHLQLSDRTLDFYKSDIEEMQVFQINAQTAAVMLKVKPAMAERLYKLTAKNIGQSALWIWDGRVLSVEKLTIPFSRDVTVHNLTSFEAIDFKKFYSE